MKALLSTEMVDGNDVRLDLAWQLFYPKTENAAEHSKYGQYHIQFVNWLWDNLSQKCGFFRKDDQEQVNFRVPSLDEASLKFLVRVISPWFDEVHTNINGVGSDNVWTFPVTSLKDEENLDAAEKSLMSSDPGGMAQRFLMPLLGPSRVFGTLELIPPGGVSARLHAHSSIDEYYLILAGEGTLRMKGKERLIREGDFIAKPAGPDSSSQFLANRNMPLRILDMEIWPDQTNLSKDVIYYPDHKELLFRGRGWNSVIPSDTAIPSRDFEQNYESGYARNKDGTWESKDITGYMKRKK